MNWAPSDGLKAAEAVVQEILANNIACGVAPLTNPTARWKMVETIAKALDGFRSGVEAEPEFPLEEREEIPYTNGPDAPALVVPRVGARVYGAPGGPHNTISEAMNAIGTDGDGKISAKRRRGRPKGAKAKKAKAAPKADAVEATAS